MKGIRYFVLLFAAASMFFYGCEELVEPAEAPVTATNQAGTLQKPGDAITYNISLLDYNFDGTNTTFVYTVVSNPDGGPAISHWDILISPDCEPVEVVSSNDPTAAYGPDGSTGYVGLKFDTGYDDQEVRTVSVTLAGEWGLDSVDVLVKSGNGYILGRAEGPVCQGGNNDETYKITGTVFFDINENGVQDTDEPGIPGVNVSLDGSSSSLTDADGYYEFDDLYNGVYTVSSEDVDGLFHTTPASVDVTIEGADETVDFGYAINFTWIGGKTADGFTIGFWKNNISKGIAGRTKGVQIDKATLESYTANISTFALLPLNVSTLQAAYDILNAKGSDEVVLLSKQLLGSEYNYQNGAYIGGNQIFTYLFLYYGEYLLKYSSDYSRTELLDAKDWYDAYNNSNGDAITAP